MAAYTFTSEDGKTYKRNLHGFEALCNSWALHDFLFAFTGSAEVQLNDVSGAPLSKDVVVSILRTAWIVLRHRVPAVALGMTYHPEDASWTVAYDVPSGLDEVNSWVDQTLVWRETKPDCLAHEFDEKWECTHGEFPLRLMVSPVGASSLSGPHGLMDGRMSMILLDQLVGSLHGQIHNAASVDLKAIKWGEEVARLAATGAVLTGLDINKVDNPETDKKPEAFVPFMPPLMENKVRTHDIAMRLVVFDNARTSALRQKCRENNTTMTMAVDAIFACAQAEAVLSSAAAIGGSHYTSTVEAYNNALHWFMPLSCKDQRPSWPTSNSIERPEGTTLFGTDGFTLQANMEVFRKAVGFSVDKNSFDRCDKDFFWSTVIGEIVTAHGGPDKSLAGYVERERQKTEQCKTFHPSSMLVKMPITSSIGDLDRLGLFAKYLPGSSSPTKVHRVLFRARTLVPTMNNLYYQYDGKLNCSLLASAQWYSPSEMDEMEVILRRWFDRVVGEVDCEVV
ncbi:hypothetical protein EV360DRAFT_80753 [Lentinula raphanica]|nr:hypothetical protein EV360DRAFT_80753 [Lentinula raphanica]